MSPTASDAHNRTGPEDVIRAKAGPDPSYAADLTGVEESGEEMPDLEDEDADAGDEYDDDDDEDEDGEMEDNDDEAQGTWQPLTVRQSLQILGFDYSIDQHVGVDLDNSLPVFDDNEHVTDRFGTRAARALIELQVFPPPGMHYSKGYQRQLLLRHFPRARQLFQHRFLRALLKYADWRSFATANQQAYRHWKNYPVSEQQVWEKRYEALLAGDLRMLQPKPPKASSRPVQPAGSEPVVDTGVGGHQVSIEHHKNPLRPEFALLLRIPGIPANGIKKKEVWKSIGKSVQLPPQNKARAFRGKCWILENAQGHRLDQLAGATVKIRGNEVAFEAFVPKLSQVFLCTNYIRGTKQEAVADELLSALPGYRFFANHGYIARASKRRDRHITAVLEQPAGIKSFRVAGNGTTAKFHAVDTGKNCGVCGGQHEPYLCPQLSVMRLEGEQYGRLLPELPEIVGTAG